MKRFRKIYLEISNICNLDCAFCPKTRRKPHAMTVEEFTLLLEKLRPWTDYVYFHLMGEPLLHPQLPLFLALAEKAGLKVILTTNGTLLPEMQSSLLAAGGLHKVNISLHAFEANSMTATFEDYLTGCLDFGQAAQGNCIVSYRLWNNSGADRLNDEIISMLHQHFPGSWVTEPRGIRIGQHIYLEHGDKFDWPDLSAQDHGERVFCYGLRDQLGVLCDGTVVPCCLDHDGDISLGNLLQQDMEEILVSPRAQAIYNGFSAGKAPEALCRRCGYARRFTLR